MNDPYLYEGSHVLRNLLNIQDEKELDLAEAELSRANMMLLYDEGFHDFSATGLCRIHKALFGDVYDWAGQLRIINIQKREELLGGKSVWYSNDEDIQRDMALAWERIDKISWSELNRREFAVQMARAFPALWQTHPFREGNTRTIVMLMAFFAENHGYYFDQELLAASAGYVRNALVMASLGEYSEYQHLERILNDAICIEPIQYTEELEPESAEVREEKYQHYQTKSYRPQPHEYREDGPELKM